MFHCAWRTSGRAGAGDASLVLAALAALSSAAPCQAADPIKIGFGMALTGGLAVNGKPALLAMKIWEEDINAKGGLLGRPVQLVYYDDQSNPATVPAIYSKLIDVDKVDLVVSGYATNMIAPAMPIIIQHDKTFMGLFGLAVNTEFKYDRYFSMLPTGPNPKLAAANEFFDVAMAQQPKPQTLAITAADFEFARNASDGAREMAEKLGLKIVYDRTYPPTTTDYELIVRAIQATNPEIVFVASYPPDSVGLVRAINEMGFKPKIIGGNMVGLQSTAIKTQLGPQLNGIVNYDFWVPAPKMQFPGVMEFLKKYQERASAEGVDALGYYLPPWAYADLQVLGEAVEEAKKSRSGQACAVHAQPQLQDHHWRRNLRRVPGSGPSSGRSRFNSRISKGTTSNSSSASITRLSSSLSSTRRER